jgi:hypothetical protein
VKFEVGVFTSSRVVDAGALHHPSFFTVAFIIRRPAVNGASSTVVTMRSAQPASKGIRSSWTKAFDMALIPKKEFVERSLPKNNTEQMRLRGH